MEHTNCLKHVVALSNSTRKEVHGVKYYVQRKLQEECREGKCSYLDGIIARTLTLALIILTKNVVGNLMAACNQGLYFIYYSEDTSINSIGCQTDSQRTNPLTDASAAFSFPLQFSHPITDLD